MWPIIEKKCGQMLSTIASCKNAHAVKKSPYGSLININPSAPSQLTSMNVCTVYSLLAGSPAK